MEEDQTSTSPESQDLIPKGESVDAVDTKPAGEVLDAAGAETPEKTVYTEKQWKEQWGKHQSATDKQLAQLQKELETTRQGKASEAKSELEKSLAAFVQKVEASKGDKELAEILSDKFGELRTYEETLKSREAETVKGLKQLKAHAIAEQHGIDAKPLLEAETDDPKELEILAYRLEVEQLKSGKVPSQKVDKDSGHEDSNWDKLSLAERERAYFEKIYPKEIKRFKQKS